MSNIAALRNKIQNEFMSNNIISANEAKQIVTTLQEDDLTPEEIQALLSIRNDFKAGFSSSGLKAFDKALHRLGIDPNTNPSTPTTSVTGLMLGRNMDKVPSEFKLNEVSDRTVRDALSRLDLNNDGKVNHRDKELIGFSDQQWQTFTFSALLLGAEIDNTAEIPKDLTGKTVCFTAVPEYSKMKKWAESMGAKVTTKVTPDLDFLVVGDSSRTGKDERALAFNTLGASDIDVTNLGSFLSVAHEAGVTGPAPAELSSTEYDKAVEDTLKSFYDEYIKDGYDYELSEATTPAEKADIIENRKNDLEAFDGSMTNPDEYYSDYIDDRYASNEPYTDRFGVAIPLDKIDVVNFDFFTDLAGIGLSKTFVFDRRTGDVIDEGDIND